jgi:hypothetical protein
MQLHRVRLMQMQVVRLVLMHCMLPPQSHMPSVEPQFKAIDCAHKFCGEFGLFRERRIDLRARAVLASRA